MSIPADGRFLETRDGLRLHYRDLGTGSGRSPVICLPGLTRNSRDFDELASHIGRRRRVLTIDFRGRGHSAYDPDWRNYHPGTYVSDVWQLLDAVGVARVVVVGTSLGGLCAMGMAAERPERLAGVVINDIGPEINAEGLERIKAYTGNLESVANWDEAVAQAKTIYGEALPGLDDDAWRRMVRKGYREDEAGVPRLDMDENIGRALREAGAPVENPWRLFGALERVPALLVWGEHSDILTRAIVDKMISAKPDLGVARVPNRGHAPLLDEPEALAAIDRFLEEVP